MINNICFEKYYYLLALGADSFTAHSEIEIMKKLVTIVIALTVGVFVARAQNGNIGARIGLEGALPVGNMSKSIGIGVGGSFVGIYELKESAKVTLTLGYLNFAERNNSGISYSLIPVLAGYRLGLEQLYIEPQLGFTSMKVKSNIIDSGKSIANTKIGYGIGAGYLLGNVDIGLRYQDISANGGGFNIIALRVGYTLTF